MTDEQIALARRAVACKGWRWMPGMRTTDAMRVIHDETAFPGRPCAIREGSWVDTSPPRPLGDALPDLTDPATLGCLLALVRGALDSPRVHVLYVEGLYRWECADYRVVHGLGATEAEALIETLEGAP